MAYSTNKNNKKKQNIDNTNKNLPHKGVCWRRQSQFVRRTKSINPAEFNCSTQQHKLGFVSELLFITAKAQHYILGTNKHTAMHRY